MTYIEHAMREFKAAGWMDADGLWLDPIQKMMCEQVLELLAVFDKHGHSGSSAPYAIMLFKTLASFEPVSPLRGTEDEWGNPLEGSRQNLRCTRIFKDIDGRAYDIYGRVFRRPDGGCYTNHASRVYIQFPYHPVTEYIDVPN